MSKLPEAPIWDSDESEEEDFEEEEDTGDCGGFGQQLFSGGSEECEFCSYSEACLKMTLEWEKNQH